MKDISVSGSNSDNSEDVNGNNVDSNCTSISTCVSNSSDKFDSVVDYNLVKCAGHIKNFKNSKTLVKQSKRYVVLYKQAVNRDSTIVNIKNGFSHDFLVKPVTTYHDVHVSVDK